MEGVGSRLSRTSSRYSGPAATTVFSGRVRKWKKKWVRVPTSSVGVFRASKSNGRNNNNSNNSNSPHHLLLHKWTPLTSETVTASDGNGSGETEEPPKRRFRYAPIAMLEHREKVATKDSEIEAEEIDEFDSESPLPKAVELDMNITDTDQTKELKTRHLKLGLCLYSEGTEE